jgi:hypothetical protein
MVNLKLGDQIKESPTPGYTAEVSNAPMDTVTIDMAFLVVFFQLFVNKVVLSLRYS